MQRFTFTFIIIAMITSMAIKGQTGLNLPYSQTFSADSVYKTGWKTLNYGSNTNNFWIISPTTYAGGTSGEMVHTTKYVYSSKTMLVSPALNTSGVSELSLSFNYYMKQTNQGNTAVLLVQSSTDGEKWTDEQWTISAGNSDNTIGPYTVNTVIKSNTNSKHTYIAFAIVGDLAAVSNWSIDNVDVSALAACNTPTQQASTIVFPNVTQTSVTASWTRGNGTAGVLVVGRKGAPVETTPLPSINYTANSVMGTGSSMGTEAFVVYKGTANAVTITNLDRYSDYYFSAFEYSIEPCYNFAPLAGKVFTAPPGIKVWKGELSEDWSNPANWHGSSKPLPTHNVIIPAGCSYYPMLTKAATVKTLHIMEDAKITLEETPNLTITDSLVINGRVDVMTGTVTANAIYSYPKAKIYIYGGTINISKWAGGPTNEFGYGQVSLYGGTLNVSGNMKLAYASANSTALFMSGKNTELNIGGSLNFSNTTQFPGGTINLLGTNGTGPFEFAQQTAGSVTPNAFNLTVNAPSKTYRFNNGITSTFNIYGNLNIIAGAVNLTNVSFATRLNVAGNVTIGSNGILNCGNASVFGSLTVGGDWDNYSAATFIPGSNTVTLNGKNQKIKGSTTFFDLKINPTETAVVTFESGTAKMTIVKNALTLSSDAPGKLALRSEVPGTQWEIDPQGARTVTNVDVRDSKNVNAVLLNATGAGSFSTGNNTNWSFSATPSISISKTSLTDFGNVVLHSISKETTYEVSATGLTADLTITAPAGSQISKTPWTGFSNSITLTPVSGGIPYQTIYVRLNPSSVGALSGSISHVSTGATTKNVTISGNATAATPVILLSTTPLSQYLGIITINSFSNELSYFVHGSNLTADLTVTVTGDFEITKTSGSNYSKTLTFTQTAGTASGIVYFRFAPKTPYSSGTLSHSSTGATTVTGSLSGNGSYNGPLTLSKSSIADFGSIELNQSSVVDSFTISGSGLYSYIAIRPSESFLVSSNRKNGFIKNWLLSTKNGVVTDTMVYVKFMPSVRNAIQGSIEVSSSNAVYKYVSLSGTGVCSTTPTITCTATSINFPNTFVNTYSTVKPIIFGGCSLTGTVSVAVNNGFELSTSPDKGFSDSLSFTPVSGNLKDTTIYARIKPFTKAYYSELLTIKSKNAQDKSIYLNCQGFYAGSPLLSLKTDTLTSFGTASIDEVSALKSYILSADYLSSDVTLVSPEGFLISNEQSPLSLFNDTLVITATDNKITDTTVYVLFNPKIKKSYNADIKHTSVGITDKLVHVSGVCANSVLTLSTESLPTFGSISVNTSSSEQSFVVNGSELTANVVITAPAGFQVSTSSGSGFVSSLNILPAADSTVNATIYARFKPLKGDNYDALITIACGSKSKTLQVSGKGVGPTITTSAASLPSFGDVAINNSSSEASFTVSGSNLNTDISIQTSAGFEVSTSSGSGFASSLSLPISGQVLANTIIYVRLKPSDIKDYSGTISLITSGISDTVFVSGRGIAGNVGIQASEQQQLLIYPNPATNVIYIYYPGIMENVTIDIFDMQGRHVIKQINIPTELSTVVISALPAGTYFVKLTSGKFVLIRKLLKE